LAEAAVRQAWQGGARVRAATSRKRRGRVSTLTARASTVEGAGKHGDGARTQAQQHFPASDGDVHRRNSAAWRAIPETRPNRRLTQNGGLGESAGIQTLVSLKF